VSAVVSDGINRLAATKGRTNVNGNDTSVGSVAEGTHVGRGGHINKVREALKQFMRDWSDEERMLPDVWAGAWCCWWEDNGASSGSWSWSLETCLGDFPIRFVPSLFACFRVARR